MEDFSGLDEIEEGMKEMEPEDICAWSMDGPEEAMRRRFLFY